MPADTLTSASVIRWTVKRGCQFRELLGWADADGVALSLTGAAFTMKAAPFRMLETNGLAVATPSLNAP